MNEYKYKQHDLCEALGVSRWTLIRWEKKGIFIPPRTMGNQRIFTKKQMEQIKKAFSPGGEYSWYYE